MSRNLLLSRRGWRSWIAKKRVQEDLTACSSKLESLQAQFATKKFLSEEELRVQAWAVIEKARQRE